MSRAVQGIMIMTVTRSCTSSTNFTITLSKSSLTDAAAASGTHRDGADAEGEDVGDRCDGDGDAGVLHRERNLLRQRAAVPFVGRQVVPTLDYHKHVVDADAWKKSRD